METGAIVFIFVAVMLVVKGRNVYSLYIEANALIADKYKDVANQNETKMMWRKIWFRAWKIVFIFLIFGIAPFLLIAVA